MIFDFGELRAGVIIQARMGSTRLPGKILKPLGNTTALGLQILRLNREHLPIYLATTDLPSDDVIVDFASTLQLNYFRGDETNVLSRYYHCARNFGLNTIIRVTSDCPLIDA